MADGNVSLLYRLLGDTSHLDRSFKETEKKGSALGSALKIGIAGGAAFAGAGLVAMAADAIGGARESIAIHKVFESQLKNMGAASRTAFQGAAQFAKDYGDAIGKDDDDILGVINKLSTFPDAFGKGSLGAEGMRRATQAAFDLQAAGIGSAESNIIGLGKAMNDPIKGITALSESGVSFTAEQQKQIKNYMAAGKLADAQKVLLAGIETNAKGAAAKTADGLARAKVALDGFAEGLATEAIPYLDRFGNWFSDKGLPLLQEGISKAAAVVKVLMGILSNPAVQAFGAAILAVVAAIRIYTTTVMVVQAVTKAWAAVQAALNLVMSMNPIGLVVLAIIALVAAFVVAYKRSETFRAIVQAAMHGVAAAFGWVWDKAKAIFGWLKAHWPLILALLTGPIGIAVMLILRYWDRIKSGISSAWNGIVGFIKSIPGRITGALGNLGNLLKDAGRSVIDGFLRGIMDKFNAVKSKLSELTGMLPDWKGPASTDERVLYGAGRLVMRGFEHGLADGFDGVQGRLGGLTASMPGAVGAGGGRAGGDLHIHTPAIITSDRDLIRQIDQARSRSTRAGVFVPVATG